jgi:hypothetical protein
MNPFAIVGRIGEAAEKGDYYRVGAEAMGLYLLGRSAVGMAKTGVMTAYNRGVNLIGRFGGEAGEALRQRIREGQILRMEAAANKVLNKYGYQRGPIEFQYGGVKPGVFGEVVPGNRIALIYEDAFAPRWGDLFLSPKAVGGELALSSASRFRFALNNSLSGNLTLRTMVHEGWHVYQMDMIGVETFTRLSNMAAPISPLEWTQPGMTARGAWNFEMNTPYGSLTDAWFSFTGAAERSTQPGAPGVQ